MGRLFSAKISHWCENFALVRKFRTGAKIRTGAKFLTGAKFRTGAKILTGAKFRTGTNDLVIFTCLVLRYRILHRNITSPSWLSDLCCDTVHCIAI